MHEMLDNLEKTMTFVSPVKDGLGVSTLDRTLLCDNRGDLFVKELAALEAAEKAKAARVASETCGLEPIGEVGCLLLPLCATACMLWTCASFDGNLRITVARVSQARISLHTPLSEQREGQPQPPMMTCD